MDHGLTSSHIQKIVTTKIITNLLLTDQNLLGTRARTINRGCGADLDNRDVEGGESNYYEQLVASVYIIFILVITI